MAGHIIPVPDRRSKDRVETECHAWVRVSAGQAGACQLMPGSTNNEAISGWWGRLRNVSSRGLSMRLRQTFEPGTLLLIELSDKTKRKKCSFPVRVVHTTAEGSRLWLIGCQFIRPLSEEDVQGLVGE
jgi:hypothetical protein